MVSRKAVTVAVAGATGAVGREMTAILAQRRFPMARLRLFASPRSAGRFLPFGKRRVRVEPLAPGCFADVDFALFAMSSELARTWAPQAVADGATVIDNSSAYRMEPGIPLVVPEVNAHRLPRPRRPGIIANPNCTAAILLMTLKPLHDAAGLKRVIVSTYQAASGAGAEGILELEGQLRGWTRGRTPKASVFAHPLAFNVIPHIDAFTESGFTKEELKVAQESRKILELPGLPLTATTVRVPVIRAHSESVYVETARRITAEGARKVFAAFPGLRVLDDPRRKVYPMPRDIGGQDDCAVGRIREDLHTPNALNYWVVGDQLRKGAALNAVQIAERLL